MFLAKGSFISLATMALLYALLPARAFGITFTVFTDPHPVVGAGTVGFAYAGNKFVGSVDVDGTRALYSCNLEGGNVTLFAPTVSLAPSPAREHYVAASLGLGGFPAGDIYVGESRGIRHITNDGLHNDVFVSNLASNVRGIVFDDVGTFGNDMLVTADGGHVYRIKSDGQYSLLASVGEDTGALDIAPLGANFGGLDGQLFVGSEGSGAIRAIRADGFVTVLPVSIIEGLEALAFVPLDLGVSGNPVEGLYGPHYPQTVLKALPSEFAGFHGHLIATSEYDETPITKIHWDGAQFVGTFFGQWPPHAEDAIFVTEVALDPHCGSPECTDLSPTILSLPPLFADPGVLYQYQVRAIEPGSSSLRYFLPVKPTGMAIGPTSGRIQWTPTVSQVGMHAIRVQVLDDVGNAADQSFYVKVGQNHAPRIESTPATSVASGGQFEYDALAIDEDGGQLQWTMTHYPLGMTIDSTLGSVRWAPTATDVGPHPVSIRVTDPQGGYDTQAFLLTVVAAGQAGTLPAVAPQLIPANRVLLSPEAPAVTPSRSRDRVIEAPGSGTTTSPTDFVFIVTGDITAHTTDGIIQPTTIPIGGAGSSFSWSQTETQPSGTITAAGTAGNALLQAQLTANLNFSPVIGADSYTSHMVVQVYVKGRQKCFAMQCSTAGSLSITHPQGCDNTAGPFGQASWNGTMLGVLDSCTPDQSIPLPDESCAVAGISCCTGVSFPGSPGFEYSLAATKTYDATVSQLTVASLTQAVPIQVTLNADVTISADLRDCNCSPTNRPPQLAGNGVTCGGIVEVSAGQPVSFSVTASDPDPTDVVTLTATGAPAGSSITPPLPVLGNPVSSAFSWTPASSDTGLYTLEFQASDGCAPEALCEVRVRVVANRPPDCTSVRAQMILTDPPAHQMEMVTLVGGADPDGDPFTIEIMEISQDEPTSTSETGDRCPDATLDGGNIAHVRWERSPAGDGRTYRISYSLRDSRGAVCPGSVLVCVPLTRGMPSVCALNGPAFNSLGACGLNTLVEKPAPTVLALRSGATSPGRQQLEYDLPSAGPVTIQAFDVRGRLVRLVEDRERNAGTHVVDWNTTGLPRGVYYLRLETPGEVVKQSIRVVS